ncbi:MAG: glycosyltransferase [Candidatus Saccharibacteria bacterium]
MTNVLHPGNLLRIPLRGRLLVRQLDRQAEKYASHPARPEPAISIVIRTKNDMTFLPQLFQDIESQEYGAVVEVIVVDTESSDGTAAFAREHGAKVIAITQAEFSYPKALNLGFKATSYDYVVTLVGHSTLSSRYFLRAITSWAQHEHFGGVYSFYLPNANAAWVERWTYVVSLYGMWKRPTKISKAVGGALGANCSMVSKAAWEACGRYDERFAGGGEDLELARAMLRNGYDIYREPLCAVYHSHGLGIVNAWKQWMHWKEVGKPQPQPFISGEVLSRRPDLKD